MQSQPETQTEFDNDASGSVRQRWSDSITGLVPLVMVAAMLGLLAGCTSGRSTASTSPAGTTVRSSSAVASASSGQAVPSTSAPGNPQAQSAVAAYLAFAQAVGKAEARPPKVGQRYPPDADFTRYSFDPFKSQMSYYLAGLERQGVAFKGTPPTPRVTVVAVNLAAKPYPTVLLSSCPTAEPSWVEVVVATGKVVPYAPAKVAPPHRVAVEMIYTQRSWGVARATPETSKTCTG